MQKIFLLCILSCVCNTYSMLTKEELVARVNNVQSAIYDPSYGIDSKSCALSSLRDLKGSLYLDGVQLKNSSNLPLVHDVEKRLIDSLNTLLRKQNNQPGQLYSPKSRDRILSYFLSEIYRDMI